MTAKKIDQLTKHQKIAIVIIALGRKEGAKILSRLDKQEVLKIASELNNMQSIDRQTADLVLKEFKETAFAERSRHLSGGPELTRSILETAFKGEEGRKLAAKINESNVRLTSLDHVDAKTLFRVVRSEHPQTLAVIVAFSDAKLSSAFLKLLSDQLQLEILARVAKLASISHEVIEDLDDHLRQELSKLSRSSTTQKGGNEKVAKILAMLDSEKSKSILEQLSLRNPDLGEKIKEKMFTFDDLIKIPRSQMVKVHKVVGEKWRIALRDTSDSIKEHVFQSMSKRAADMLKSDLADGKPLKKADVETVKKMILADIKKLEEKGEIVLDQDDYV